jgi:leucyl/phenylalanyl-tRNA--protein transferase
MELSPELLLRAYAIGIFPMAESRSDTEVHWIDPDLRGVLPLEAFHAPRGLRRKVRKKIFDVRCNSAFPQVVQACAKPTPGRSDTWINPTIERLYGGLHEMGFAHSVECWQDDRLVGGLYGVSLGAAFFGESMFSVVSDASKVALVHLVARLRKSGFLLLDTQFETPHLRRFGVVEIPRDSYREQLANAVRTPVQFPSELTDSELSAFLQSITQTS